jgi:multidrug efflux system membrane fusion protein
VQTGQNGEFLFVVKSDQTVEARPVTTGITYDGVRVITSGVKSGETIVTDGQLRLTPGATVTMKTNERENGK